MAEAENVIPLRQPAQDRRLKRKSCVCGAFNPSSPPATLVYTSDPTLPFASRLSFKLPHYPAEMTLAFDNLPEAR
jgi:hypothetical protein